MMLHIPGVLSPADVQDIRQQLDAAGWADGALTAGSQAAHSKRNLQLSPDHPAFAELSGQVRAALERHPLFIAAALPAHILPPMFNCYQGGGTYGNHVDNTVQQDRFTRQTVRTDVSTTVFLSDPDEYRGVAPAGKPSCSQVHCLRLAPLAQQVVIVMRQVQHFRAVAQLLAQFEDGHVQLKQHTALPGVAHQALRP